jgi:hypothetical protein
MSRQPRDILSDLVASGLTPDQLALVMELAISSGVRKPSSGAERTRRWRETKASQNVTVTSPQEVKSNHHNVTGNVTERHGDVTPNPASISILSSSEIEDKKERKKERGRGTRLPHNWVPNQININFAVSHNWQDGLIGVEGLKFRNFWTSKTGQGATKLNWDRTWENWVLNYRGSLKGKQNVGVQADRDVHAAAQRMAAKAANFYDAPEFGSGENQLALRAIPEGGSE